MRASLRIKYPDELAKAAMNDFRIVVISRLKEAKAFAQWFTAVIPPEAIVIFISIKIILSSFFETATAIIYAPYAALLVVIMIRFCGMTSESEDRKSDIDGAMVALSVVAYAIWNSAIAVFFFLCTLLLVAIG